MARKVFVSYHHDRDQRYADEFRDFYSQNDTLLDKSLRKEIDSDDNDYILSVIRSQYLKDSTITVVLIGVETWARKWVDWEIYSSLRPYGDRTINGLLGVVLPGANKWPERLSDNYRVESRFGTWVQTGYAKVIQWADIAPPPDWRTPWGNASLVTQRREYLSRWIDYAFDNRTYPELINNNRPRMKNNRSTSPSWW